MSHAEPDHYATLQITSTASTVEIRTAYRELIRATVPRSWTVCGSVTRTVVIRRCAKGKASQINAAYDIFSDPSKRAAYDRQRKEARAAPFVIKPQPPTQSAPPQKAASAPQKNPTATRAAAARAATHEERLLSEIFELYRAERSGYEIISDHNLTNS
jgi:curved DNA-binding protein CbpA